MLTQVRSWKVQYNFYYFPRNRRMLFFYRNTELKEEQISKFHLTLKILNSQNSSSSLKVRCSDWEDSEKGVLIQSYNCVEVKGKYYLVLSYTSPRWFDLNLRLEISSLSASSSGNFQDFFCRVIFFQNFYFHLKPRILFLEIKLFSPSPWIYSTYSTSSCDEKMSTK